MGLAGGPWPWIVAAPAQTSPVRRFTARAAIPGRRKDSPGFSYDSVRAAAGVSASRKTSDA